MSSIFGDADEAVYYTLLLMPPSGNINETPGYTTVEIYEFWVANVGSSAILAVHSPVVLTQSLVDAAIALGAARALYKIVFADGTSSRYIRNPTTRQFPVPTKKWLVSIGVFDNEIAAELARCRVLLSVFTQAPALASSVQPPCRPEDVTLAIELPNGASLGCSTSAAVALALGGAGGVAGSCEFQSL